jgi:hypothetical protein
MADKDMPNRSSNMEKAEGDRQEPLVERQPHHRDPTRLDEERTSDNSTVDNGGIGKGREENPTMPGDDPSLRTEI